MRPRQLPQIELDQFLLNFFPRAIDEPRCRFFDQQLCKPLPRPVKLIKIDAEGHDGAVIAGMWQLICASMPTVITEHPPADTITRFEQLGYAVLSLPGSPNKVFIPPGGRAG